jgi:gamma-D-glutamyl-L-lysine dipeptidyl-peptidase
MRLSAEFLKTIRKPTSPWLALSALLIALFFSAAPIAHAQSSVPKSDFVAAKPVLNVYAKPSEMSDVTTQVIYGTGVLSLEKQPGWVKIQTADGYTGWVSASDLIAQGATPYAPDGLALIVSALSANVYRDPDVTRHAPLLRLPWEARLERVAEKVDTSKRWLEVRLVDGQSAWVQQGDVKQQSTPLSIEDSLQLARKFLGTTYTWGGVSSFGFDCSGFTQMLVRQRGIIMPRDAGPQASWSGVIPVDRKDLQPGDLLFFGSSPAKITHTGMYLGNGEFIHDTTNTHPGVQISRLDDAPWTRLLVAARRIK